MNKFLSMRDQVALNTVNIDKLFDSGMTIVNSSLQINGIVSNANLLPSSPDENTTFLVGSDPYELYVFIQAAWKNLGPFPAKGADGADGQDGKDGTNGRDGVDGKDGTNGRDGQDGTNGVNGATAVFTNGSLVQTMRFEFADSGEFVVEYQV